MHSDEIQALLIAVNRTFGSFEYYGSSPEEVHGVCFKLKGINATFSASTLDGGLKKTYDVQIEGIPPGDYVFTAELQLSDFMLLIEKFKQPISMWPCAT